MRNDFKAFIMRGNVLDLAVGVIIGAAFGTVVKSLVDDVIMPRIGLAIGGVDFKDLACPAVKWRPFNSLFKKKKKSKEHG